MKYKIFLCLFVVILIFTSFGFDGSLSSETSAVSSKPQSLHFPVQTGDCDWRMFGRTPEDNRVAPDGCVLKTDQLELLAKWDGPIGRPAIKLLIENTTYILDQRIAIFIAVVLILLRRYRNLK